MTVPESSLDPDAVLRSRRGRVLLITLNRPQQRNAINTSMSLGLLSAIDQLNSDPDLMVGVLTGAGGTFCSGLDLKALAADGMPKGLFHFLRVGSEKPLIAAIEGFALAGGLEIALVCDLLVAARDATLGVPETKVGLFPGGGALLRLPQQLPHGVVVEMALTGSPISAELAYRYGLVTRLTGPNEASDSAIDLAESIAGNAPLGVRASKQVIRRSKGLTEEEFWEMQNPFSQSVFSSQDSKEGASAFAERREPRWTGT